MVQVEGYATNYDRFELWCTQARRLGLELLARVFSYLFGHPVTDDLSLNIQVLEEL